MKKTLYFLCIIMIFTCFACSKRAEKPAAAPASPAAPAAQPASAVAPAAPAAQPASAVAPAASAPAPTAEKTQAAVIWSTDFMDINGWYDVKNDPTYMASITLQQGGKAKITEVGEQNWGKVAFVFQDIDFDRQPYLTVVVDSVKPNSSFGIGVDNMSWNDFQKIMGSSDKSGTYELDLTKTNWAGVKSFNCLFIVEGEGGSCILDKLSIGYKK